MGLSAFSRARVSQLPELELEAKRFDAWNKMHQTSFRMVDDFREEAEEEVVAIREAMIEGVKKVGEKVVAGLAENTKEGDPVDLPLRLDHVRDMVGRRHIEDPQGEPKSTLERLHERIPTKAPASENMAHKVSVDGEGPTAEEVEAAEEEQAAWTDYEEVEEDDDGDGGDAPKTKTKAKKRTTKRTKLPAAGEGAGVKGNATRSMPGEKVVPKTTAVAPPSNKPADKDTKK